MNADLDIERRLTQIESTLPHLATKADLANLKAELIKWMVGLMLGSITVAVAVAVAVDRLAG